MVIHDAPAIKIKHAVDYIEESCRIVVETIELVGKHLAPGITTKELDAIGEDHIRSRGATPSFKGYPVGDLICQYALLISVNDAVVHGLPSDEVVQPGDVVTVDCGAYKNGYHGDSAFTFAVGAVSEEKQKLLRVAQEALMPGVEQATSRNKVYHISGAIQRHVEKNGFSLVRELSGHGIGAALHEEPSIPNFIPPLLKRDLFPNVRLQAGQALAIEPMVNAGRAQVYTDSDGWTIRTRDGKPAAHFEHTVVVQEHGSPIILTLPN
jgi:methionyl aminopeptidase